MSVTSLSGRAASMARRHALAAGKAALPAPTERVRTGFRSAEVPAASAAPQPLAPSVLAQAAAPAAATETQAAAPASGRALLRLRRQQLARGKAGLAVPLTLPASADSGPSDGAAGESLRGRLEYPPKVFEAKTHGGQRVTGLRIGPGAQVTGDEAGAQLPISGTQYVASSAQRPAAPKVGIMRTDRGLVVSGTLVRSRVAITGDEAGETQPITGELDGRSADDLTPREQPPAAAQFPRRTEPHGSSVFGIHLGRAALPAAPQRVAPERTAKGLAVTGTAVGRSVRVTGDEEGACRTITGDQYATPPALASECGGRGGGSAPREHAGGTRPDPVTGAKVSAALSWSGQRITGPSFEHDARVTGDEPGSCAVLTGTPYQGPRTAGDWCASARALQMSARRSRAAAAAPLSGDVPRNGAGVTGTERGAGRTVTGTPYYVGERETVAQEDAVVRAQRTFSVRSPQREAQLAAREAQGAELRVTGSFMAGSGKVTGNKEFLHRSRASPPDAARPRVTGEGRTEGPAITGDAWRAAPRVTGTEGYIAAERNPSERAGKPHAFAGAGLFKGRGRHDEPRQIVTGMVGWTAKSAAKVTLSGGAQG